MREVGVVMWFLWLLVLYSAVGGQDLVGLANQTSITGSSWTNQTAVDRNERFFSFFNVIRFRNVQCTGVNGQYGTCYSRQECTRLGGIASGGCARNWGTCCIMYVDFQEDNVPIQLSIRAGTGASVSRKWNIKVSQIDCASPERAPAGALMYYRALTDTVKSFNYGRGVDQSGTRQIVNTNYGVFVRAGLGYCSITWSQVSGDVYTFTVSGDTEVLPTDLLGTATVALSGEQCTADFIVIPNPSQGGTSLTTDRFCGNALVPTTTSARPFVLTVVTDDTEMGTDVANRGFNLMYRQIPCD
ncbi:uncharacterized protein LOC117282858 [Cryptotermes secundus]|uniref:uncharacterized protein LOC117282858 n=1 Tax=Cryptotermes secundus TaxID=105785 RepID=UPI001454BF50|nr:uncharacterized protein LOC117282858 [Cryptotermes secundus]